MYVWDVHLCPPRNLTLFPLRTKQRLRNDGVVKTQKKREKSYNLIFWIMDDEARNIRYKFLQKLHHSDELQIRLEAQKTKSLSFVWPGSKEYLSVMKKFRCIVRGIMWNVNSTKRWVSFWFSCRIWRASITITVHVRMFMKLTRATRTTEFYWHYITPIRSSWTFSWRYERLSCYCISADIRRLRNTITWSRCV